jgi:hypothetical protein
VGREVRGAREVRVAVEVRLLGMFHPLRGLGVRVAIRVRANLRELEVVLRRPRLEKLVLLRSVHEQGDGEEEVLPCCGASVAVLRWASAASRRFGRGGDGRRGGHSSHHGSHHGSSSPKV